MQKTVPSSRSIVCGHYPGRDSRIYGIFAVEETLSAERRRFAPGKCVMIILFWISCRKITIGFKPNSSQEHRKTFIFSVLTKRCPMIEKS